MPSTIPRPKANAPIQVLVEPEERHELKLKAVRDRESMQGAVRRLIRLYIAGELPQAEPQQDEP